MIVVDGTIGRLVPLDFFYGVRPADFAGLGNSPSPLSNDVDPGDESSEWMWALLPPLPASGTTQVTDNGGYALTGAANGTYSQAYRAFVLEPAGGVSVYESAAVTQVGTNAAGAAWTAVVTLAAGGSTSAAQQVSGAIFTATATMQAGGGVSGLSSVPGAALAAAASVLAGGAVSGAGTVVSGAGLSAVVTMAPGGATSGLNAAPGASLVAVASRSGGGATSLLNPAPGAALQAVATLQAGGAATQPVAVPGASLFSIVILQAGGGSQASAPVAGAQLGAQVQLLAGGAFTVGEGAPGAQFLVVPTLAAGGAETTDAGFASSFTVSATLRAGGARSAVLNGITPGGKGVGRLQAVPEKDPRETVEHLFVFPADVSGEVVMSVLAWSKFGRRDDQPGEILDGDPIIAGPAVLQRLKGGLDLVDYYIDCEATVAGKRVVATIVMPVREK